VQNIAGGDITVERANIYRMVTGQISPTKLDLLRDTFVEILEGYIITEPARESNGWSFDIIAKRGEVYTVKLPYVVEVNDKPENGDFFIASGRVIGGLLEVQEKMCVAQVGKCAKAIEIREARRHHGLLQREARYDRFDDFILSEQIKLLKRESKRLYRKTLSKWNL